MLYVVLSRDNSNFLFCTFDQELAEQARETQEKMEEMQGGRPSVFIKQTKII